MSHLPDEAAQMTLAYLLANPQFVAQLAQEAGFPTPQDSADMRAMIDAISATGTLTKNTDGTYTFVPNTNFDANQT